MKKSTKKPWMPAPDYSRTLQALSINLIVRDIPRAVRFQIAVIGAEVVYEDEDFAVLRGYGSEWMLHADHTYDSHPMHDLVDNGAPRGVGVEIRLHGCDPDAAASNAARLGYRVLDPPRDKPHGLREAYILDEDGYIWVPDRTL